MSTVLVNLVGDTPSTKKADRGAISPTEYETMAIERGIKLSRSSEEERLFGALSYRGVLAEELRTTSTSRPVLPEAPRPIQQA